MSDVHAVGLVLRRSLLTVGDSNGSNSSVALLSLVKTSGLWQI